ncbi:MAG: DUF2947 domain-containing protein [Opitutaceae bacterium]|jgi:hypothetical protein|nr:DUF2947 domain-containing protein [Opitutaceae bacterium]
MISTSLEEIPLDEWRYAWRIEQLESPLSALDRERIRPLSVASSKRIAGYLDATNLHGDFPFKEGFFHRIESLALTPVDHQDKLLKEDQKVKKWLYRRGIPFDAPVFLTYDSSTVVLTTWKMLVRHWQLFYYSISDDLTVCDHSMNWCLLFFHEHELFFGTNKTEPNKPNLRGQFENC